MLASLLPCISAPSSFSPPPQQPSSVSKMDIDSMGEKEEEEVNEQEGGCGVDLAGQLAAKLETAAR